MSDTTVNQQQHRALKLLAQKNDWIMKGDCVVQGANVHGMTLNSLAKRKLIAQKKAKDGTTMFKILKKGLKALD